MTHAQAMKLAVACIDARIKQLNVNANMFDQLKLDTPGTRAAADERRKLREARALLAPKATIVQQSFEGAT